jgi:hypothetical protein
VFGIFGRGADQSSSSSTIRRRFGRLAGFAALAFMTTTPSAASAPRSKIEPQTIPMSLNFFDRPLDEDEELSSEEEDDAEDSEDGEALGAGVLLGSGAL